MTAEPYCPVPFDDAPYENRPLDARAPQPSVRNNLRGADGGARASSAPDPPPPVPQPASLGPGALELCPTCLIELDDWLYCSSCSYQAPLKIDRLERQPIPGAPLEAEGGPC